MRIAVRGVAGLAAVLAALVPSTPFARQNPQPPVFRSGVDTVAIYATVRDRSGRLVHDLTKTDFEVLDNGRPAEIRTFSNEIVPFTAVMLLDMSNSMAGNYLHVLASAASFVQAILPADRLRIGTFGREVALSPWLTGDKAILTRVLDEEVWLGGATPLWRAASAAMDSLAAEQGRRVVLFISDGGDSGGDYNCAPLTRLPAGANGPCPGRGDVRRRAEDDGFMFYAIGLSSGLDQSLRDIADSTGGGHFTLTSTADLESTFARVADELHHQYVIGFIPVARDGKTHTLEVRVSRPNLVAKARKSYVAGSAGR